MNKLPIIWSPFAEKTYLNILNYLITEWSLESAMKFDKKVQKLIELLQTLHKLCPKSPKTNFRKCTVTPQTSLIYCINNDYLEIVAFIDNRSGHDY